MNAGAPSLFVQAAVSSKPIGVDAFLDDHLDHWWYYGASKVALRDALATVAEPGENVLLPSYVPDAVAEAFRELDLDVRYYAIRPDLGVNMADVERRVDERTLAIVTVNYFGFPQPTLDEVSTYSRDRGYYHIDDNAHAATSVHDGRLLGTHGDIGVTSLWKTFPVSDGALLYLPNADLRRRFEPSALGGARDRFDRTDLRYLCKSLLKNLSPTTDAVWKSVATLSEANGAGPTSPTDRYEESKKPMSKLSSHVLATVDPLACRERRRANFRAWLETVGGRRDIHPLYRLLPDGICPQAFPVVADRPERFIAELSSVGVDSVHTWPRLPSVVDDEPTYETASFLSRHIVVLPVHQQLDPEVIRDAGRAILERPPVEVR